MWARRAPTYRYGYCALHLWCCLMPSFTLIIFSFLLIVCDHYNNEAVLNNAVKSNELKWLPHGSEFPLATENTTSSSTSKPKTYTSFSCSQDSLPEFSDKSIGPKHPDIIIAKLGPGQVILSFIHLCFAHCQYIYVLHRWSNAPSNCFSNWTNGKGLL